MNWVAVAGVVEQLRWKVNSMKLYVKTRATSFAQLPFEQNCADWLQIMFRRAAETQFIRIRYNEAPNIRLHRNISEIKPIGSITSHSNSLARLTGPAWGNADEYSGVENDSSLWDARTSTFHIRKHRERVFDRLQGWHLTEPLLFCLITHKSRKWIAIISQVIMSRRLMMPSKSRPCSRAHS